MSSNGTTVKKVLFVDDSTSFLNMIERVFGVWCKGSWEVIKAEDGPRGLTLLDQIPVHVIVIDMLMPGMDGLEFLRIAHKRYPEIPKVMLTGMPAEASKTECLNAGAVLYLEKPGSMEGMEGVYTTIDELVKSQLEGGFKGMMHHVRISEVLQVECLNRNSSVMEITSGKILGLVYVRNGEIIHAQARQFKGSMALSFLMALKGGEFALKPFTQPSEITVGGSWEALLMEAAQFSDESGSTFTKSADTAFGRLREQDDSHEARLEQTRASEGKLISLGDGAYEWTGPKPERLIDFLAILRQQTAEITENLGGVEQIEIYGDNYRFIAEAKAEGGVRIQIYRMAEEQSGGEGS